MQITPETPKNEQEVPGIVGHENAQEIVVPPTGNPSAIRKTPPTARTFHDHYASHLVIGCLFAICVIWIIDFCCANTSEYTTQVMDLLKTVITTCLGYLFAAHKYGGKDTDK